MTSKYFGSSILVLATAGAALLGCDSIKDVRHSPSTPLPTATAVLEGTVSGLSSKRPVQLTLNGEASGAIAVTAPPPSEANEELEGVTPFNFGTLPVGTQYNVTVYRNPLGKTCSVTSGGSGTLQAGVQTHVVVNCVNSGTRYSMTVNLDHDFASSPGAQVVLTTEEAIYRISPGANDTSVTFDDVLFNASSSPQVFNWNVVASNTVGGTLNKCPVINATNPVVAGVAQNPTGDISNVQVNACSFTIGGTVSYSLPVSGATTPPAPSGLVLELRDLGEDTIRTQAYSGGWGGSFTFNEGADPVKFVSNRKAIYSVVVNKQPDDMHCVVVNPMAILFAPTLTSNPTNITSPSVQCRLTPTPDKQLRGVYRHVTTTWKKNSTAPVVTSTYDALDFSRQNNASSNMIAFFPNGTFIYGTHANTVQIEHGFYDYDPVAGTLRFTLNADTGPSVNFPANFSPANANSPATVATTTNGMSSLPGTTLLAGTRQAVMENVDTSTAGVISGTFHGAQTLATTVGPTTTTSVEPDVTVGWVLEAPPSIEHQMTGAWLAKDSRRLWVFDKETYYGTHVGVVGVYTMNDACFTMPDVSVSSGLYTRRPSINGCYPWPRAATNQQPPYSLSGFVESVDTKVPQFIGSGAGQVDIGTLPEYMARIPGGAQAIDGRSPSPMYFHIAAADDFYDTAPSQYFPPEDTDWCDTEILGIRATLNAVPIHKPVYFCRFVP